MLPDPMLLSIPTAGEFTTLSTDVNDSVVYSDCLQARTVDIGEGSSKRVLSGEASGSEVGLLTIANSNSNENAPLLTKRTLVRLDRNITVTGQAKPAKASVYVVIARPIIDEFTSNDMKALVQGLLRFLLFGEVGSDHKDQGPDLDLLSRILNGEP